VTQNIQTDPPLAEHRRQLRALDKRWTKELQKANKAIAALMVDKVRESYSNAHRSTRAVNNIKPRASQTWSGLALGGVKVPYLMGQNFGANRSSRDKLGRRMTRFPERRKPDYHVYAQLEDNKDEIIRLHTEMVEEVMREAYPGRVGGIARRLT
jgi:hypothetical protein